MEYQCALYVRLSREDGDKSESDSVGNQKKLLLDYLKNNEELKFAGIYVDDGYTGTNFLRPAFSNMILAIEEKKVNCVIVKDLSRFGRDYIETGAYLERYFPSRQVRFISVTDNIDSILQTYDMLLPIKNIFNEQYARDISKKVQSSIKMKQYRGEFIGAFAAYGYQKSPVNKNQLVIDPYAAAVVQRIFSLYLDGFGKNSIAKILNEEGIVCPSEYKKRNGQLYHNGNRLEGTSYWTYPTIHRILQNEMYIGNMVQGKKRQQMRGKQKSVEKENWVVVPETHEPVIDRNTWEKAQKLLNMRTRTPNLYKKVYLLAGYVRCGLCQRAMVKKQNLYYCGTYVRAGHQFCKANTIDAAQVEAILLSDLNAVIARMANLDQIIKEECERAMQEEKAERSYFDEKQLREEENRTTIMKRGLYEDYRQGLMSKEDYIQYYQEYEQKVQILVQQRQLLQPKEAHMDAWMKCLLKNHTVDSLDREILYEMLEEVRIFENQCIAIRYRFDSSGFDENICCFQDGYREK